MLDTQQVVKKKKRRLQSQYQFESMEVLQTMGRQRNLAEWDYLGLLQEEKWAKENFKQNPWEDLKPVSCLKLALGETKSEKL